MAVSISIGITQNSQSIANNTSNVTVKVTAKWTYGSWNGTGECTGWIKIDGTKYSFSDITFNTGQTTSGSKVIMTKTVNVSHGSDGKKTLDCSASFVTGVSSGTVTASASKTLTTIARKSTLSVASSGTLGSSLSLTVTRKSTSLTHTIKYTCGDASGTICTKSSDTSLSWTPPYSLAKQNAGGTSVSVTLTITTYSGSTSVGSNSYTVSCSVPSSTLSASNGTLGTAQTLSISRKSSSFTHTITYTCGSASGTIASKTTGTSVSWTPPWSLALQAVGKTSVSVTLTITTYLDGVKVGASKTKTISCAINSSSLAVSTGTLGTAQTLTVTRASSYYHTIKYVCGSASGTICTLSSSTSISWTPPLSLASQNPTGTTVTVEFEIRTFSTSTSSTAKQIGAAKTKIITCSIPSSVKPSVTLTLSDSEGHLSKYGKYVNGKSVLNFSIAATESYGAAIKSYKTTFNGKSYTTASGTIPLIAGDGLSVSTTVTDARGRTTTVTKTIDVYSYTPPKVTDLVVRRCNENSTSNPSGAYLAIDYSVSVTELGNKNSANYTLKYKKADDSSYTVENLTSLDGAYVLTGLSTVIAAEPESTYDIILTVADDFSSISKTGIGASVRKVWSIPARGLGFAFGKIAEYIESLGERFEVGWNARFYKDVEIDGKLHLYPVGSVVTTTTNTNPSSFLGGTWELFDKGLKELIVEGSVDSGLVPQYFTTANLTDVQIYILRKGDSLRFRLFGNAKVELGDSTVDIGQINFPALGVHGISFTAATHPAGSDGGNSFAMWQITYDGVITHRDTIHKSNGTIGAGTGIYFDHTFPISKGAMYDSACDKFYWKRTA